MIILASELVSILKNLYGKCSSYSDKGIVVECDHGNKSEKVFETVFNRPGQLILKTYDSSATEEEEKVLVGSVKTSKVSKYVLSKLPLDHIPPIKLLPNSFFKALINSDLKSF